jgi:hypothetical protein
MIKTLTPYSTVLPEKLVESQLLKKCPKLYGKISLPFSQLPAILLYLESE